MADNKIFNLIMILDFDTPTYFVLFLVLPYAVRQNSKAYYVSDGQKGRRVNEISSRRINKLSSFRRINELSSWRLNEIFSRKLNEISSRRINEKSFRGINEILSSQTSLTLSVFIMMM